MYFRYVRFASHVYWLFDWIETINIFENNLTVDFNRKDTKRFKLADILNKDFQEKLKQDFV